MTSQPWKPAGKSREQTPAPARPSGLWSPTFLQDLMATFMDPTSLSLSVSLIFTRTSYTSNIPETLAGFFNQQTVDKQINSHELATSFQTKRAEKKKKTFKKKYLKKKKKNYLIIKKKNTRLVCHFLFFGLLFS